MVSALLWDPAPKCPSLSEEDVHVWAASLEQSIYSMGIMDDVLSSEERVRAGRFFFGKDRERYIVTRGTLRTILGRYLGVKPGHLRFEYNSHGKPSLTEEFSDSRLKFNVSHSQQITLLAFTVGREIGVDIEQLRPKGIEEGIAERFFSPREVAELQALPQQMRVPAFFTCWTRKEAYIKAKGEGLSIPLDQFEVSVVPGQPAVLKRVTSAPEEVQRWTFQDLLPAPGCAGAVCVEGGGWALKCWRTPEGW